MRSRIVLAFAIVTASCGTAAAHSPMKGIGAFYNGLLHPVLVPAHLLALVAIGLLIGQHAPRDSRVAVPAFAVAVAFGLALASPPALAIQWPILAIALVAGLVVALGRAGRLVSCLLAVAAALAVSIDSKPDALPGDHAWLALGGTGMGVALVVIYCGGLAAWLDRPWQRIAVRALGSWIAASAILVLTLGLRPPAGIPA